MVGLNLTDSKSRFLPAAPFNFMAARWWPRCSEGGPTADLSLYPPARVVVARRIGQERGRSVVLRPEDRHAGLGKFHEPRLGGVEILVDGLLRVGDLFSTLLVFGVALQASDLG